MDKRISVGLILLIVLVALIGCYFAFIPHYKTVEMSGYTFEVPDSNVEVKNNTINYNTYIDTENDLTIKTWACKDINDIDGTVNASIDMGVQLGENMGVNTTYNNISLYNKSGVYTYYEPDIKNSCIIIITSKNLDTIEHILETMSKPKLNIENNPFNMTTSGLVMTDSYNNDTSSNQTTTSTKSSSNKKSSKSSSSSDGYIWSEQYGDYIKQYTDSNGVQHIDSKKGYRGSYNPRTNELKEENYEVLYQ